MLCYNYLREAGVQRMKVEIWSDYVCPFCYIGRRRFEKSLEKFPHRQYVTIEYKSYELAPGAETNLKENYYDAVALKYGISVEEAIKSSARIRKQAAEIGLNFDFNNMKPTNTFDAHRIAKFAAKQGKGKEITERLLHAYFTESYHISNHDILIKLASEIGLSEEKVITLLQSKSYSARVLEDEDEAKSIGIKTVPFFIFNEKYAVSGLQKTDVFTEILEQVWEIENENHSIGLKREEKAQTTYCSGEGCSR